MGVKGLATFVKDNQNSVCRTVTLEPPRDGQIQKRVPVVVDAWGVIFQLWLSSLPWTSGGEYLRFYRLVHRLVSSWRSVGLEPIFMFDGSAPSTKIDTILSRLDDQLRTARLFYTTSPASRSAPSFSRSCGKILLPPLASQTFIHALHDAGVETHFMPAGEADGACVSLAEERGGYVFGLDSDYYVLVGGAGLKRVRGYCPTDMMSWVDEEPAYSHGGGQAQDGWSQPRSRGYGNGYAAGANGRSGPGGPHTHPNGSSGWSTAAPRQRHNAPRTSPLLPPADARNLKLLLRVITPAALRARLRLPPQMMPLFGALIGNDHTPPIAPEHFFEPGLNYSQRVDKVARVIREVVFAPASRNGPSAGQGSAGPSASGYSTPSGSDAGDHAYHLVKRIMARLAWKPFVTESIQTEVMEGIIEATVQYALPSLQRCCDEFPFCGEMVREGGCENSAKAWAEETSDLEPSSSAIHEVAPHVQGRQAYAAAQKKGVLNHATHVYLYPNRILMWAIMEDPAGPSLKAEEGAREMRTAAYLYIEEALGGLLWEANKQEQGRTEDENEDDPARTAEAEVPLTREEEDWETMRLLATAPLNEPNVSNNQVDIDMGEPATPREAEAKASVVTPFDGSLNGQSAEVVPVRHMVEFARHTNRHIPFRIDLPSTPPLIASGYPRPMAVSPLKERLRAYLTPLHSATPLVLALPPCLQPLAAYVRFCTIEASVRALRSRGGQYSDMGAAGGSEVRWRPAEVIAVLKAGVASFACWSREKVALNKERSGTAPGSKSSGMVGHDEPLVWPELSTRNSHILSELGSAMTDSLFLAQALLLLPDTVLDEGMPGSPIGNKREASNSSTSSATAVPDASDQRGEAQGFGYGTRLSENAPLDIPADRPAPTEARMPTLTHLTPFVFFSGVSLHMLLRGETPPGWQWSDRDEKLLQTLLAAVKEDLADGTVKGWKADVGQSHDVVENGASGEFVNGPGHGSRVSSGTSTSTSGEGLASEEAPSKKDKKKKTASSAVSNGKAGQQNGARGGRFDILGSSFA